MNGKGLGISINAGGTNNSVRFKHNFTEQVYCPLKIRKFAPLVSFPFKRHDRQAEMDAYRAIWSACNQPA
jgi:hypothetical protein